MVVAAQAPQRPEAQPAAGTGRAEAIVRSSDILLAAYLLGPGATADWGGFGEESCARFLLRFALEWRHGRQQAVFSPEYLAFLDDPAPPFATRLMAYVFLRDAGARARFGRDIAAFEAWFHDEGATRHRLVPLVCARRRGPGGGQGPWADIAPMRPPAVRRGVNLVGFADGVLGLGEDLRMMARAALRAGLHVAIVDVGLSGRRVTSQPHGWDALMVERPLFPVSIFCLPPFEMMRLRVERGPDLFTAAHAVGCWPWELTSLPPEWRMAFGLVDEIWAISPFLAEVYGRLTTKPVRHVPPHVAVGGVAPLDRAALGLGPEFGPGGGAFVVLSMLDLNSFAARKNPQGSIAAFRQAFPDRGGRERLIVKTLNGAAQPELLAALEAAAEGDPRVAILDRAMSRPASLGLIQAADALLSLHRSEGFGRVLAEAMLLGVPVVATGWSGVMSYLDEETGWPVPFALRPVRPGEYVYGEGSVWAEPDIAAAALILRRIAAAPDEARRRAQAARTRIGERHGLDAVAARLAGLIAAAGLETRATTPMGMKPTLSPCVSNTP